MSDDTSVYNLSGADFLSGIDVAIPWSGDGAKNQFCPSAITPTNGAWGIFEYVDAGDEPTWGGVAADTGTYRVVYFAFGFEAIDTASARNEVVAAVLDWLTIDLPGQPGAMPPAGEGGAGDNVGAGEYPASAPNGVLSWITEIAPGVRWSQVLTVTVEPGYAGPLDNIVQVTADGIVLTDTCTVIVEQPHTDLVAANDSPTVLGQPTAFRATAVGSHITYTWAFGDGQYGHGANVTHTYVSAGTYTAVVTAGNSLGLLTTTIVTVMDAQPTHVICLPVVLLRGGR